MSRSETGNPTDGYMDQILLLNIQLLYFSKLI